MSGGETMGKLDGLSIYISMLLRHRPEEAHITLDEHGWANVDELLACMVMSKLSGNSEKQRSGAESEQGRNSRRIGINEKM